MQEWVKFHRQLCKGEKRGIPRAIRFVYMELSLEALELHGVIRLPLEMSLLDAVHDRIGGNRTEIEKALKLFTANAGADGQPSLAVVDQPSYRELHVRNWVQWNSRDWSAGRVRGHRERKKNEDLASDVTVTGHECNGACNGHVTLQIRSEEIRREEEGSETGPQGPARGQPTAPPELFEPLAPAAEPPSPIAKTPTRQRGTRIPEGWRPSMTTYGWANREFGWTGARVDKELEEFCDYWRSVAGQRGTKMDWDATFRVRVRQVAAKQPQGRQSDRQQARQRAFACVESMITDEEAKREGQ